MLKFLRPTKSNQPIKIRKSFLIKKFFFAVFLKKVSNICSVESQQTNITNVPRGTLKQTK